MMPGAEPKPTKFPAAGAGWFCLRSQPKHEHIAAAHLQTVENVEVFLPRVRFQRPTRQGLAWVTEALFPNYLFARFDWHQSLRQVQASRGVGGVVHFGERWPVIPDSSMRELQLAVGTAGLRTISAAVAPGDSVKIVHGPMQGLMAVVSRVMPARERVSVLMEFLGRPTEIEVSANSLLKEENVRATVFTGPGPDSTADLGSPL